MGHDGMGKRCARAGHATWRERAADPKLALRVRGGGFGLWGELGFEVGEGCFELGVGGACDVIGGFGGNEDVGGDAYAIEEGAIFAEGCHG